MVENKENTEDRAQLIETAVKFLINPNIQRASEANKKSFLKKKGLTEDEIQIAFNKALSHIPIHPPPISHSVIQMPSYPVYPQMTWWWKIREILNSVALMGGIAYAIYWFYKKYIYPYLFGVPKEKTTLDSIKDIEKSLTSSVGEVKTELRQLSVKLNALEDVNERHATSKQLYELKTEIATVKGLLLNRKQFPAALPPPPALGQPSIPAWQLCEGDTTGKSALNLTSPAKSEEREDSNSNGSNSGSETSPELVTNGNGNGSDSSLEIVREPSSTGLS